MWITYLVTKTLSVEPFAIPSRTKQVVSNTHRQHLVDVRIPKSTADLGAEQFKNEVRTHRGKILPLHHLTTVQHVRRCVLVRRSGFSSQAFHLNCVRLARVRGCEFVVASVPRDQKKRPLRRGAWADR